MASRTRSGRLSQPALRFEDEMANRQASFRSQPRRAVGEQLLIEEDEVIAGNVTRELEERPNNLEDIDVDAEEEFWNGGNQGDERGGTEVAQGGGGGDPVEEGGEAEAEGVLPDGAADLPTLEEAHCTYIPTHKWPPKAVRSEFTRVVTSLWQQVAEIPGDVKLRVKLLIFCKCVLPAGQGPNATDPSSLVDLIRERLRRWQNRECGALWREAVEKQRSRPRGRRRKRSEILNQEQKNVKRCATKASEGQFTKAIQSLTSLGMAEYNEASIKEMQDKHPPAPRPLPPSPSTETPQRTFTSLEVVKAALSFRKGTAAGPSGLRPEHLQVALKCTPATLAERAQSALLKLVLVLAKGKLPPTVAPFFCGARLHAATKKDQSLRPIAVGNLLRRLVAKCFSVALADKAASLFSPNQLGVGVRAGAEAIPQAVKKAIDDDPSRWVLQSDLINAFNTVERTAMLEATQTHFPECLAWVVSCYGAPSCLRYGETTISSDTGLHQGDPLAGLFFCLAIKPLVDAISNEVPALVLNAWYLDDGHIIGSKEELAKVVDIIVREGEPRGLTLSRAATVQAPSMPKSVVWSPTDLSGEAEQDPLQRGIPKVRGGDGIVVLGAPVGYTAFVKEKLQKRVEKVQSVVELLPLLKDPHSEFVLLRSCLSLPKIMFMLRAVDTTDHLEQLTNFDLIIRGGLSRILGANLTDQQWAQSSLPSAMGGLGLRCAIDHAPIAHAVSLLAAKPLLDGLLGEDVEDPRLPQPLLDQISAKTGEEVSVESLIGVSQKSASLKVDLLKQSLLLLQINEEGLTREIARMASLGLPHAGNWLSVVPSPSLGLHLRAAEFVPIMKYRLGLPVYSSAGTCPACSQQSDRIILLAVEKRETGSPGTTCCAM